MRNLLVQTSFETHIFRRIHKGKKEYEDGHWKRPETADHKIKGAGGD